MTCCQDYYPETHLKKLPSQPTEIMGMVISSVANYKKFVLYFNFHIESL